MLPSDPDFPYATPDTSARAAFIKDSRMKFVTAYQLRGKYRQTGFFLGKKSTSPMSDQVYVCGVLL
jgi:hypothetical protein